MTISNFISELQENTDRFFNESLIDAVIRTCWENKKASNQLQVQDQFGIYIFFLKDSNKFTTYKELEELWIEEHFIKYPKAIKKNFASCYKTDCYYTFYVGKSEKLKKRISQHFTHEKNKTTSSLKLIERTNFSIEDFEIGYWTLPVEIQTTTRIKQFIITTIEQKVREKVKPLVGKE